MTAAWSCLVGDFGETSANEKLGALSSAAGQSGFATQHLRQISAWETELAVLGKFVDALIDVAPYSRRWHMLLEYAIPRRGKRPDVVLLADDLIFVIEFKVAGESFEACDEWQTMSYALDLRDFHAASAGRTIIPILLLTGSDRGSTDVLAVVESVGTTALPVQRLGTADGSSFGRSLLAIYSALHNPQMEAIDGARWEHSAYRPSPTIIEAAETLFAGHSVTDISHAFALNLESTSQTLLSAIENAQRERSRTICFVTGIPGAGKTLAGLNAVHNPMIRRNDRPPAVFLSGNGPLVKVVREALTRNRVRAGSDRRSAHQAVSAFINNVHGFLEAYGIRTPNEAPHEHAIVFDEAQRAWDVAAVAARHGIQKSEPELILEIMARAQDWCVVVALVGGGQEIYKGEAGLAEWGRALNRSSTEWQVMASAEVIRGGASVAGHRLFENEPGSHLRIVEASELHLDVGVRSPRAHWLGRWVNMLLTGQPALVETRLADERIEFPIALTRDLAVAKAWLRERADGPQRYGLLASSGALRLRPHGIEVSADFRRGYRYVDWFLAPPEDCRSSVWLEVPATEFECQGLELDWAAVCWGGDLVYQKNAAKWHPRRFRGSKWQTVSSATEKTYTLNKYRVLLTRARRGMVVWVPHGDQNDPTRSPDELDATAEFLMGCGLPALD